MSYHSGRSLRFDASLLGCGLAPFAALERSTVAGSGVGYVVVGTTLRLLGGGLGRCASLRSRLGWHEAWRVDRGAALARALRPFGHDAAATRGASVAAPRSRLLVGTRLVPTPRRDPRRRAGVRPRLVLLACGFDVGAVLVRPLGDAEQRREQRLPERGKRVVDARRDDG